MKRIVTLFTIMFIASIVPGAMAKMTSTNFQAKNTEITVGGSLMSSDNFNGRLVVDQASPLEEIVVCFGNHDTDHDVDGKDMAEFAASPHSLDEYLKFAREYGRTDCDK